MKWILFLSLFSLALSLQPASAIQSPTGLVSRAGDSTLVLHWDRNSDPDLSGYRVYRSLTNTGPFTLVTPTLLTSPGFAETSVLNGQTYYYYATAVSTTSQESTPSVVLPVTPHPFANDDAFLDYIQEVHFDYFWYLANPNNGLVPDRSALGSSCSIAAVGFGLTAIGIAIDHGWISRTQGVARVLTTLGTFLNQPQGPGTSGIIGYNGWFYHFLDMNTALRCCSSELSSIDTTLLLGGILCAKQYFDGTNTDETSIRTMADAVFNRVDWNWMAQGTNVVSMGWYPGGTGFLPNNWIGYNEGMIIYILGLGTATNPLPASSWGAWTSGYTWLANYGQTYVVFPPMFGYQYSHCWVDFRYVADSYMNLHNSTYFENSRRASLAQVAYAIANPNHEPGYSSTVWGLTACDVQGGYSVHGIPPGPGAADDGTIAPTAAVGSIAFTPEYSLPTLRYFYNQGRVRLWTPYGFRDAFNARLQWYDPDELGIDQGPIVIMIENYRTQRVWNTFMKNPEAQRGLQRAGFVSLDFVTPSLVAAPASNTITLTWDALPSRTYQVEYSPDLAAWFGSSTGEVTASGNSASWTDSGPPGTPSLPFSVNQRFYRVFQFGPP
jgi:hypothetical protein